MDPYIHIDICQKEWRRLDYKYEKLQPHFFPTTFEDLPKKNFWMEEERVVNSTWKDLKENFIRDLYFSIEKE